nr:hypothetical transcript [Hymenolepis microstoma]
MDHTGSLCLLFIACHGGLFNISKTGKATVTNQKGSYKTQITLPEPKGPTPEEYYFQCTMTQKEQRCKQIKAPKNGKNTRKLAFG